MISPKITKTHQEHLIFEDVMAMEEVQEPLLEEDSVNQGESQISRNNDVEEGSEDSVRQMEENSQELEEFEESVIPNEEVSQEAELRREDPGSEGSSCDRSDTVILLWQRRKKRSFEIPNLSENEEEEGIMKRWRIEEI